MQLARLRTTFGQQFALYEAPTGTQGMVLTPTAGPSGGAYVFTMSLFAVDFAKNTSTKVADVGDFGLPPELAAGYPATSYGEKMYAILGGQVCTAAQFGAQFRAIL